MIIDTLFTRNDVDQIGVTDRLSIARVAVEEGGARGTFPNRFNFTIGSIVPWFKLCLTNARIYDRARRTLIVIPVNIGNYLNGRAFRSPGKWKCFFQKFDRRNLTRWMADRTFMRRARFERYLVCSVEINCIIYIFFILLKKKKKRKENCSDRYFRRFNIFCILWEWR